jgi:N-6 DNA Methylase
MPRCDDLETKRDSKKNRRNFGQHFTSLDVFKQYILPEIKTLIHQYVWVDMYAGSGNLILPILDLVPKSKQIDFFKQQMFLFDVQPECIGQCIENAIARGIPQPIAEKNIKLNDSLKQAPALLQKLQKPIFHLTNPPYLYLGYIVKNKETQKYLPLFKDENKGYQDLYQIAMINDMKNSIQDLIYIIPSNFLFGNSVSNKFRDDFLQEYSISKVVIFEKQIFDFTGTNVIIVFLKRKKTPSNTSQIFEGIKIGKKLETRSYNLSSKYHYKAGGLFEDFITEFRAKTPLKCSYYLKQSEVEKNSGSHQIKVIDSNQFEHTHYKTVGIDVNQEMKERIINNPLWVRTVDTGQWGGRAGLYLIQTSFNVDGILVSKNTYRTNPIQIFFKSPISVKNQHLLLKYFNLMLEYLRKEADSEFMTTYKYSGAKYTRKYFGLSQAKKLIETFPILDLNSSQIDDFEQIIEKEQPKVILTFCKSLKT